nr:WhiB family transcriptional regulator [Actinocrispum wychmicini]
MWLEGIAWRLDRLRFVPRDVLTDIVTDQGVCTSEYPHGEPPRWTGHDTVDRALATRLCARCPVQDECLELELRTAGEQTVGVWGALPQDDRRALYPHWRRRGDRAEDPTDPADGWEGVAP